MTRLLSSLLLATSLTACLATKTEPRKPVSAETQIQLDRAQIRAKLAESPAAAAR